MCPRLPAPVPLESPVSAIGLSSQERRPRAGEDAAGGDSERTGVCFLLVHPVPFLETSAEAVFQVFCLHRCGSSWMWKWGKRRGGQGSTEKPKITRRGPALGNHKSHTLEGPWSRSCGSLASSGGFSLSSEHRCWAPRLRTFYPESPQLWFSFWNRRQKRGGGGWTASLEPGWLGPAFYSHPTKPSYPREILAL